MGFFDKFKKGNKQNVKSVFDNIQQENKQPFEITRSTTQDGNLQIDFYDKNAKFGQSYEII